MREEIGCNERDHGHLDANYLQQVARGYAVVCWLAAVLRGPVVEIGEGEPERLHNLDCVAARVAVDQDLVIACADTQAPAAITMRVCASRARSNLGVGSGCLHPL